MAFRHPIRNEFDSLFHELDKHTLGRSLDSAIARVNIKMLRAYVEVMENERELDTPGQHFLYAVIAALANQLAATIKFTIDHGEQVGALPAVLDVLREQVGGRLDKPVMTRVLFPGFDPPRRAPGKSGAARAAG